MDSVTSRGMLANVRVNAVHRIITTLRACDTVLSIKAVYRTGYTVIGASVVSALALVLI